ncbi:MAG: hypothetical protein LUI61_02490 [Firmicutes bacterium]|nr:hypothetical protein [Bacillota bacterium]
MKKIKLFMYAVLILAIALTMVGTHRWYKAEMLTAEGLDRIATFISAVYYFTVGVGGEVITFQIITYFFVDKPKKPEYRNFIIALLVISVMEIIFNALMAIIDLDFSIFINLLMVAALCVEVAYFVTWLTYRIQDKQDRENAR